jgi:hypothetical protein
MDGTKTFNVCGCLTAPKGFPQSGSAEAGPARRRNFEGAGLFTSQFDDLLPRLNDHHHR